MLRKTLTILSLLGMLLSVGLWGVSYYGFQHMQLSSDQLRTITLADGVLLYYERVFDASERRQLKLTESPAAAIKGSWNRGSSARVYLAEANPTSSLGRYFPALLHNRASRGRGFGLWCPLWCVALVLALWPISLLTPASRRRRWRLGGLCEGCGYDLRGSEDTCPECGRRFGNHVQRRWMVRETRPRWVCIVSGIAIFCVLLPALPFVSAHLCMILTGKDYLPPIYNSTLVSVVVVTVVFAYASGRVVYFLLRWRRNPNREHDGHVPE